VEENLPPAISLPSNSSAIGTSSTMFDSIMDTSAFHLDLECTTGIEYRQAVDSSFRHSSEISGEETLYKCSGKHVWTASTKAGRTLALFTDPT
jgi:hypothetical protein